MKKLNRMPALFTSACLTLLLAGSCSDNPQNGSDNDVHSSGTWDESVDGERRRKTESTSGSTGSTTMPLDSANGRTGFDRSGGSTGTTWSTAPIDTAKTTSSMGTGRSTKRTKTTGGTSSERK